jgi:hypothetical protein
VIYAGFSLEPRQFLLFLLLAGAGSKTGENPQSRGKFLLESLARQFTHSGITPMGYKLSEKTHSQLMATAPPESNFLTLQANLDIAFGRYQNAARHPGTLIPRHGHTSGAESPQDSRFHPACLVSPAP